MVTANPAYLSQRDVPPKSWICYRNPGAFAGVLVPNAASAGLARAPAFRDLFSGAFAPGCEISVGEVADSRASVCVFRDLLPPHLWGIFWGREWSRPGESSQLGHEADEFS